MSNVQASIVDFRNDGSEPLHVSVVIGGSQHHVATLQPGESIRQVTPGHVEWRFSNTTAADGGAGDTEASSVPDPGGALDPDQGGGKGEKGAK